jgi:hypothetical protein
MTSSFGNSPHLIGRSVVRLPCRGTADLIPHCLVRLDKARPLRREMDDSRFLNTEQAIDCRHVFLHTPL